MKNKILLGLLMLITSLGYSQCEYSLELINANGSIGGWGGNSTVSIEVDGIVMVNRTRNFGTAATEFRNFDAYDGATITAIYRGSQNNSNVEFRVLDSSDNILIFGSNFSTRPFTTAACPNPCLAPSGLTVTDLFSDSATLEWDLQGTFPVFDLEWGLSGFTLGSGTQINLDPYDNYYYLNFLTESTSYDYYVRSKCDGNTSWTGPFTFTTTFLCEVPQNFIIYDETQTSVTIDWSQNGSATTWDLEYGPRNFFEGSGTLISGITTKPYILNGLDPDTEYDFNMRSDCGSGVVSPWSQGRGFNTRSSCELPDNLITSGVSPFSASVDWRENGLSAQWDLEYGPANFVQGNGIIINDITSKPYTLTSLNPDTAYDFYVRSDCDNGVATGWSNKGSFTTVALCDAPSFFFGSAQTSTTAIAFWQENGVATSWDIEYGPTNFVQGTGTVISDVTSRPYTINGLNPGTNYEFYVRSDCGNGFSSSWAGTGSFSTPCSTVVPNYQTDFTTFLPACWDEASTGTLATGPDSIGFGDWSPSSSSARINLRDTGTSDWLLTPEFNLSLGGYELVLNTNATDFNSSQTFSGMGSDDQVQVVVSDDNGNTWTPIYTFDTANPLSLGSNEINIDLSAYSATNISFGIYASEGSVDDLEDYYVYINNFQIRAIAPTSFIYDGISWNTIPEGNITSSDSLTILSGNVSLSSSITANNVIVMSGATLTANAGDVNITGNLINDGVLLGTSDYHMTSTAAQVIDGDGSIDQLKINNSDSVTISGSQAITKLLTIDNGSLMTNDAVTFKSNASGTAVVAPMRAGTSIIGNVIVERFIPASNRAFRFLGSSVIGQSVFDSWQEGGINTNGFGTHITGTLGTAGINNMTTGHDETASGNASLFKWDNANQNWATVLNTKTEFLNSGTLYRIYVRGNRTVDLSTNVNVISDVTLRTLGTLTTGNYTVTGNSSSGTYLGVANPYQSKIDMSTATSTNISNNIYYWDPTLNTRGAYTTIDITSSAAGTNGSATRILEPGQAVFLEQTSGASSIMFSESDKVSGTNNVNILSAQTTTSFLRLKLYNTNDFQNGKSSLDGLIMKFDPTENIGVDQSDAAKFNNLDENMAIKYNSGSLLAIDKRPAPLVDEIVDLEIERYRSINYTFTASVDMLAGLKVYIKDNLDGTMTEVIQGGGNTVVDFIVDQSNAASMDKNRFQIVFETVTLGMEEQSGQNVALYPNPVTAGQLNIQLNDRISDDFSITIYNTLGQQINAIQQDNINDHLISINGLELFTKGVYFLKLNNDGKEFTSQFVID